MNAGKKRKRKASSEDSSSTDKEAFLFLFLPALIQGVSVSAVVTRPVSLGTKTGPADFRTCTIQSCDALFHVHQHANRTFKAVVTPATATLLYRGYVTDLAGEIDRDTYMEDMLLSKLFPDPWLKMQL